MNTNNKEALSLVRNFGFNHLFIGLSHDPNLCPECIKPHSLDNVVLQDNEDTEVKEEPLLQNNPGHEHLPSGLGKGAYCVGCLEELDKPSSKVEKLKELQEEIGGGGYGKDYIHPMCDLIDILLEDEE